MVVDINTRPNKRVHNASDLLSATIYIASEKYLSDFTFPCYPPKINFPCSDIPAMYRTMMKDKFDFKKQQIVYCVRYHNDKIFYKNIGCIYSRVLFIRGIIIVMILSK